MKLITLASEHPFILAVIVLSCWIIIHHNFIADNNYDILAVSPDRIVECVGTEMAWTSNYLVTCEITGEHSILCTY